MGVFGAEVVVGYVCAYLVRKARHAAGAADAEVDRALDAGMERVHGLVSRALGEDDPALLRAGQQAAAESAEIPERTRRRLADALEEAAEGDPAWAAELQRAVAELWEAEARTGAVIAGDGGIATAGSVDVRADHGSVAALRVGDVALGNPPVPGPRQD